MKDTQYFFFLADAYVECHLDGGHIGGKVLFCDYWGWEKETLFAVIREHTGLSDVACQIITNELMSQLSKDTQECYYTVVRSR